jgi:hypothetical protein
MEQPMTFRAVFENPFGGDRERVWRALWEDPKYLKIHERKDQKAKDWNYWDAYSLRNPEYREKKNEIAALQQAWWR